MYITSALFLLFCQVYDNLIYNPLLPSVCSLWLCKLCWRRHLALRAASFLSLLYPISLGASFLSPTRSDQIWSFPSHFSIVSGTTVSRFLIVTEQPLSIQNRSGSIVRKPGVAGEMSGVSQSEVLFTIDGFQASW